MSAMLHWPGL